MLESLIAAALNFISSFGYLAILLIMIANSMFIPIPTEITLPFAGFLAKLNQLSVTTVIFVSILGELIGATITYFLGYFVGERFVDEVLEKRKRLLFFNRSNYEKAKLWLRTHGFRVIFLAKFIPGLSTPTSLAAGISGIKYHKFISIQILVSLVYNSTFVLLGYFLGSQWGKIIKVVQEFQIILLVFLVILIVLWFLNRRFKVVKLPKRLG